MLVAICDDDNIFLDRIKEKVKNTVERYDCLETQSFSSAGSLIDFSKKNMPDIIILDIDMPDKSGFDVTEEMQMRNKDIAVIYVTNHIEYAYQAYEYQPYWFIYKNDLDKLDRVLSKLIEKIQFKKDNNEIVNLKFDKIINIDVWDVLYLESYKNDVIVHCKDSEFRFRATIKDVYRQLSENFFINIHRGYIVNCRYIYAFKNKYVKLTNGEILNVTRDVKKLETAKSIYGKYMRDKL